MPPFESAHHANPERRLDKDHILTQFQVVLLHLQEYYSGL